MLYPPTKQVTLAVNFVTFISGYESRPEQRTYWLRATSFYADEFWTVTSKRRPLRPTFHTHHL